MLNELDVKRIIENTNKYHYFIQSSIRIIQLSKSNNKSEAKLVYMYVEELIIKYNFKEQLKYERATSYYVGEYRSLEKIYHRIMGYTDERNELRKKNAVLYLEACLVSSEQEND